MIGVATGFVVIASIIAIGFFLRRFGVVGEESEQVLSRLSFIVLTPALLLTVLSHSDSTLFFSALMPVFAISALSCFVVAFIVAQLFWRRGIAKTTVIALASGYVNGNNIGLPIALYVLGDASLVAPIILINLTIFAPIALAILEMTTEGQTSLRRTILKPLQNPIILASVAGLAINLLNIPVPEIVLQPFALLGGAAIPTMLLLFGISLNGAKIFAPGVSRADVVLATILKTMVMPTVAYLVGRFVFHLSDTNLLSVVVIAALPMANNVFFWAHRFNVHVAVARDALVVSLTLAIPTLLLIVALLSP